MLQMFNLRDIPEKCRLLQHQQQIVLRHSREISRQAKRARWHDSSHRITVCISVLSSTEFYSRQPWGQEFRTGVASNLKETNQSAITSGAQRGSRLNVRSNSSRTGKSSASTISAALANAPLSPPLNNHASSPQPFSVSIFDATTSDLFSFRIFHPRYQDLASSIAWRSRITFILHV